MTTKNSPLPKLRQQAEKIAASLKAAARGEAVSNDPAGKIAASLKRGSVTFAVVMDDKIIKIELPWTTIRETDEAGIVEYILSQMREEQTQPN